MSHGVTWCHMAMATKDPGQKPCPKSWSPTSAWAQIFDDQIGPSYTELNLFGLWVCVDMERRLIYNDITTLSIVE